MIYLVISAVSLVLMVMVYRLTLSSTTFHGFNRYVLLSTLALAAIVPLMHFQSVGRLAAAPVSYMLNEINVYADGAAISSAESVGAGNSISVASVITLIYLAGVAFCLLRVVIGILSSEVICHRRSRTLSDGSRLVITDRNYAPFSWRNYIVISRKDFESNGALIIAHEQAHVRHHHSFDLILAQLFCAVQWFNPAAWMLKRSLLEVHEFEADASVLEHGFDERRYQICLVRAALQGRFATTTNNFANCSTKKRIVMMKKHSTNPWARLRVLLMLPAVAFSVVVASASNLDTKSTTSLEDKEITWTVDTTDVFLVVEDMPEYPGGNEALIQYLSSSIKYPESCKEEHIEGQVLITFVVEKTGRVSDVKVIKSVHPELDAEAKRVIEAMPDWKPGKQRGEEVRVQFTIPVTFNLGKKNQSPGL